VGLIKTLKLKYSRKNCYTMRSSKSDIYITICGDIGAARLTTPQMSEMVEVTNDDFDTTLSPVFAKAYKMAVDANDQAVADEIHAIRHLICYR